MKLVTHDHPAAMTWNPSNTATRSRHPDESCLACSGALRFWFTKKTSTRGYDVYRCGQCGSAFVMPRPSEAAITSLYRQSENGTPHGAEHRYRRAIENECRHPALTLDGQRIADRLRTLVNANRVLDVGAGDGFHTKALGSRGFDVDALEPNSTARAVFRRINGFEPRDGFLDSQFVTSHQGSYDAVLLSQVLEHLIDPGLAVEHVRRLLRPQGVAAIAVPHFRSWLSVLMGRRDMFISPPEHLNYLTSSGLTRLTARHGFEPAFDETVTWFDPDRVIARVRTRAFGHALVGALRLFFAVADRAHKGNTLEAYFRRKDE